MASTQPPTSSEPTPSGREAQEDTALIAMDPGPADAKRSLWQRLAVLGGGRGEAGREARLDIIATRMQVLEEQLRELGVALDRGGEVANTTASEFTDRIANEIGRVESRLGGLEQAPRLEKLEQTLDTRLAKLERTVEARLGKLEVSHDERLGKLEAHTHTQLEHVEQKLGEVWEMEEQVAQLPEVLDRLTDLRDAQLEQSDALDNQRYGLWMIGGVSLLTLAGLAADRFLAL